MWEGKGIKGRYRGTWIRRIINRCLDHRLYSVAAISLLATVLLAPLSAYHARALVCVFLPL